MANHKSAKKRIRQTERRRLVRRSYMSSIRTAIKGYKEALDELKKGGEKEKAVAAFKVAQSALAKGAKKGLFHKNNASRKTARLAALLK